MHKYNLVIRVAPPRPTWRDAARRALAEPIRAVPKVVEVHLAAHPASWEGRRHLEALDGEGREKPPVVIRPLALVRPEVAA